MEELKNIKRRERRFYRKIENDKIEYDIKSKENNNIPQNNLPGTTPEKKEIIENILSEIKNSINPNIDEITEIIYDQLNINNLPIDQETVKEAIYRNRHKNPDKKTEESEKTEPVFLSERKELETVIDDILDQLSKSETLENKYQLDKNKKENSEEKNSKRPRREEKTEEPKKSEEKPKEEKKTKTEKPKPKKEPKKSEMELDFGEDVDNEDLNDSESDDDLGLKF